MEAKPETAPLQVLCFPSPLGWIVIAARPGGLCLLHVFGKEVPSEKEIEGIVLEEYPGARVETGDQSVLLRKARDAVLQYLANGAPFPPLPLDLAKGTPFQQDVWKALCEIPPGETRSYGQIAERIGRPRASRAVGQACGKNPVAVVVPCHRVVASGGKLGGYSGGLHIKKALLELERRDSNDP